MKHLITYRNGNATQVRHITPEIIKRFTGGKVIITAIDHDRDHQYRSFNLAQIITINPTKLVEDMVAGGAKAVGFHGKMPTLADFEELLKSLKN